MTRTPAYAIVPNVIDIAEYDDAVTYAKDLGYQHTSVASDTIYDAFTEEDIFYLCRMVESETYGASFISRVYVAEVALARYRQRGGELSLKTIITSPNQFSYWRTNISQETIFAVEYAYKYATEAQDALFFKRGSSASWYGYDELFICPAGHSFYGTECELAPIIEL